MSDAPYSAIEAVEYGIGQGPNGSGKRPIIRGAYTINRHGRKVCAFRDSEGGLKAAQEWANTLNKREEMKENPYYW